MNEQTPFITLPELTPLELRMLLSILDDLYMRMRSAPGGTYVFSTCDLVLDKSLKMDAVFMKLYYKLENVSCSEAGTSTGSSTVKDSTVELYQ